MAKAEELQNCGVYLDLFHSCSSIKGRLRTYYREGKVNSCMPYWNDFWFCLKAKIMNEEKLQMAYDERLKGRHSMNSAKTSFPTPDEAGIWRLKSNKA